jgi:hypothetical protein
VAKFESAIAGGCGLTASMSPHVRVDAVKPAVKLEELA